jgi:hypothetical protein
MKIWQYFYILPPKMTLHAVHWRGSLNRGRTVVVAYYCFLESSYLEEGERDGKATAKWILRK